MTFDLCTPQSDQFIPGHKWMFGPDIMFVTDLRTKTKLKSLYRIRIYICDDRRVTDFHFRHIGFTFISPVSINIGHKERSDESHCMSVGVK